VVFCAALVVPLVSGCGCNLFADRSSLGNNIRCAPTVAAAVVALPMRPLMDKFESDQAKKQFVTLEAPGNIATFVLPARSVVVLRRDAVDKPRDHLVKADIQEIRFPYATSFFGATVMGSVKHDYLGFWAGALTGSQDIQGQHCKGEITFSDEGQLIRCDH
jgi:hypothetical protein